MTEPDRPDSPYELLVNAITDYAVYMLDPEGRVTTWNPGAERFKGYSAGEIIGEHFSRFFTEEDREADLPARALRIAAREGRFEAEGWRVRKDGTRFWANAVLDPIRSPDGTLLGFAKITRDITDRKHAERALRESEQRFQVLVRSVTDYAIYMLDPQGIVATWNAGARRFKGYEADEIIGEHFSRFFLPQDRKDGLPARILKTAAEEGRFEAQGWRLRKDGTRFLAHVVVDRITDDDGQLVGFAKITRDITERKRAEAQLAEAQAALLQSQKLQAIGELTGGIAHDFNNLMTVISGSVELLRRRPELEGPKRERYLRQIADTADRATKLVSQLLAFGRRQALQPEVLDLNVRLDAFGEMMARTLGSLYTVTLDLAPSPGRVEADPVGLETALMNAVLNSRDAMASGGAITIATADRNEKDGAFVAVSIADNGDGMSRELLERVFEPFFTTKPVGKGTGLGLAQIHGFAEQSGGRVEIVSSVGQGTTLTLLLPRTEKPLADATKAADEARIPVGLRVLLTEDSPQVREFARQLLVDLKCEVTEASNGEEALRALAAAPIDVLFSDVVMPGMSGVELARTVQREWPDLRILLTTGYSDQVLSGDAEGLEVLRKPYGPQSLAAAIGSLSRDGSELPS